MAAPTYRSSSSVSANTGLTFTVTKPAGAADNDLLTAFQLTKLGGGSLPATPAGWTLKETLTLGTSTLRLARYEKLVASDGASYTFNGPSGSPSGNEQSVWVICSSPGDTASEGKSSATGSSTSADPGTYTTNQNNELLLGAWGIAANMSATITPDASFTVLGSIGSGSERLNVGYKSQAAAGATSNTSATISSLTDWGAILAAIPPPPAVAPISVAWQPIAPDAMWGRILPMAT